MFTIIIGEEPSIGSSTLWNKRDYDIKKYLDREPALLQSQMPLQPFAFFNGWWLPPSYREELGKFLEIYEHPLDALNELDKRKKLQEYLKASVPQNQRSLFERGLEEELAELAELRTQKKPLYARFKKKEGEKERSLSVPKKTLESVLRTWVLPLIKREEAHSQCHGGEPKWTPERSIRTHIPFKSALTFDLANAYGNTNLQYVFDFFYRQAMKNEEPDAQTVAGLLTLLTTVHYAETGMVALPQGSPASTALFNRIVRPIDEKFIEECRKRHWTYTRWIDDMTLSSPRDEDPEEMAELIGILREDFPIATKKVFFQQNRGSGCRIMGHIVEGEKIRKAAEEDKKPEPYQTITWMNYEEIKREELIRDMEKRENPCAPIIGEEELLF